MLRGAFTFASQISVRIFILEGLLTIAISVVAIFLVPTWPQKAKWVWETTALQEDSVLSLTLSQLTDAERSRLLTRLDKDSDDAVREEFAWEYVRQAFVDPLVWGYAFLNHGFAFTLYTLSLFMVCLYQVGQSSSCANTNLV